MLPEDAIGQAIRDRVDTHSRSPGMVLGVISKAGRSIHPYGRLQAGKPAPVLADSLFEIGSITKPFTALLLADAALRGELALQDPIDQWLHSGITAPSYDDRRITLADLATHGSGLPSWLDGAPPFGDPAFNDYSAAAMLADLAAYRLTRPIGSAWEYSNTGYGLVGLALAAASGRPYETLLRERVLDPLGMSSTAITLTPQLEARTASPHDLNSGPVSRAHLERSGMASAGALWSSAGDMLTFLGAALGLVETPLAPAFAAMLTVSGPEPKMPNAKLEQNLGWLRIHTPSGPLMGHNGGTFGMASSALVDAQAGEGVIILTNAGHSPSEMAIHLLRPDFPLNYPPLPPERTAVAVPRAELERCVGRYQVGDGPPVVVELDARGLIVRPPGAPRIRATPAGDGRFFVPAFNVELAFDLPPTGPAAAVTLKAGGPETIASRVPD